MTSNTTKIMNGFNTFFESNETYTRKELLEFAKKNYDDNYKKTKKVVDENAIKKPLNAYQLFMKEQRIILNKRESERTDGEKKKSTELMKEIAEMWKIHKANNENKKEEIKKDIKEKEDEEENVEENKKEIKKDSKKNNKKEDDEEENVEENKKEIKKDSKKNKKEEENEEEDENLINSKADTEKNDDENKSKLEKKPSKKGSKWTNL